MQSLPMIPLLMTDEGLSQAHFCDVRLNPTCSSQGSRSLNGESANRLRTFQVPTAFAQN